MSPSFFQNWPSGSRSFKLYRKIKEVLRQGRDTENWSKRLGVFFKLTILMLSLKKKNDSKYTSVSRVRLNWETVFHLETYLGKNPAWEELTEAEQEEETEPSTCSTDFPRLVLRRLRPSSDPTRQYSRNSVSFMLSHIGKQLPRGQGTLLCSSEGSLPLEPSLWSPATSHVSRVEPRFSLHICAHFNLYVHYPSHPSLSLGFKPNPGLRKPRVSLWDNISCHTHPSETSVVQAILYWEMNPNFPTPQMLV